MSLDPKATIRLPRRITGAISAPDAPAAPGPVHNDIRPLPHLDHVHPVDITLIHGLLYGRQDYPENTHHIGFDWSYLKQQLELAGFTDVRRYDVQETIHKDYDDYSQAYLRGRLVSLNVEATKPAATGTP